MQEQVVLFLLGEKGYQVLRAACMGSHKELIRLVVVGTDKNVNEDFSDQIRELCERENLTYCTKGDKLLAQTFDHSSIAIAAGWRWLIKDEFLKIIILHDSLLPKYRGFNPLVSALLAHERKIGVTALLATGQFDSGNIIDCRSIEISYPIKIATAIEKVAKLYFDLSQAVLASIYNGSEITGTPQQEGDATFSVWRDEDDYRIDFNQSSEDVVHFINCHSAPYKGASAFAEGTLIRIHEAECVPDVKIANRDVGKVLFVENGKPIVICAIGLIRINKATDEHGKDVLPFSKFRIRLR